MPKKSRAGGHKVLPVERVMAGDGEMGSVGARGRWKGQLNAEAQWRGSMGAPVVGIAPNVPGLLKSAHLVSRAADSIDARYVYA